MRYALSMTHRLYPPIYWCERVAGAFVCGIQGAAGAGLERAFMARKAFVGICSIVHRLRTEARPFLCSAMCVYTHLAVQHARGPGPDTWSLLFLLPMLLNAVGSLSLLLPDWCDMSLTAHLLFSSCIYCIPAALQMQCDGPTRCSNNTWAPQQYAWVLTTIARNRCGIVRQCSPTVSRPGLGVT